MIKIQIPAIALALSVALAAPIGGAIPKTAERKLQAASPEQLTVVITELQKKAVKKGGSHRFEIVAKAKVEAAKKTGSALKKGDVIELRYSVPNFDKSPQAGAWPTLISEGMRYKAFLKVRDTEKKLYQPAAMSGSFEKAGKE